jgi:hypothetical protein
MLISGLVLNVRPIPTNRDVFAIEGIADIDRIRAEWISSV